MRCSPQFGLGQAGELPVVLRPEPPVLAEHRMERFRRRLPLLSLRGPRLRLLRLPRTLRFLGIQLRNIGGQLVPVRSVERLEGDKCDRVYGEKLVLVLRIAYLPPVRPGEQAVPYGGDVPSVQCAGAGAVTPLDELMERVLRGGGRGDQELPGAEAVVDVRGEGHGPDPVAVPLRVLLADQCAVGVTKVVDLLLAQRPTDRVHVPDDAQGGSRGLPSAEPDSGPPGITTVRDANQGRHRDVVRVVLRATPQGCHPAR